MLISNLRLSRAAQLIDGMAASASYACLFIVQPHILST